MHSTHGCGVGRSFAVILLCELQKCSSLPFYLRTERISYLCAERISKSQTDIIMLLIPRLKKMHTRMT